LRQGYLQSTLINYILQKADIVYNKKGILKKEEKRDE